MICGAELMPEKNEISRKIRLNIFDGIEMENVYFGGRLDEVAFLSRLYDLTEMPSTDYRYTSADGDINQHCVFNNDWDDYWIFSDTRFALLDGPDKEFLDFLCEMIHPLVRPNQVEQEKLADHFNDQLRLSGWKLIKAERIAGRSRYLPQKIGTFHSKIDRAYTAADVLSSNWMQTEIKRIQDSVETDPALAIGTAKDLIESCCKAILEELGEVVGKSDDLPTLSKKMCKRLGLVPEGVPKEAKGAETVKIILSNFAAITKGIAELRGLYGSGHGRDGNHVGLEPRHARLAASSAIAFVDFATETFLKHRKH